MTDTLTFTRNKDGTIRVVSNEGEMAETATSYGASCAFMEWLLRDTGRPIQPGSDKFPAPSV